MAEQLTNEQQAAVDSRGRSLLVSAAAGSGKTKVLVERLFSYVEREGANLDDFLIITYTRAAASELRGKIAKALTERMERDPGNEHLRRQMLRVYRADIKTVDAFCTALLRENCHLLGEDARGHTLRPDFRVLDENDAQALRERVLARTLDDFYARLTPGGALLADTLGAGRDDSALEALVLELHAKLQAQPYEDKWLDAQRALWSEVPDRIEKTPYGRILLDEVRRKARHWQRLMQTAAQEMTQNDALNQKYAPAFLDISYQLEALTAKADEGWDAARGVSIAFPRLAPVKDSDGGKLKMRMKALWDGCKAAVKGFGELLNASSGEAAEDLRTMAPAMLALIDLTAEFSRRYNEEKRRRNAADFSDQEHEAIRLLIGEDGTPTELARTVSTRYREIMVDEYQDTNEVQNRIFDAISCKGENLFTVGDVKQSIYRFRLADPRIFLQHYNTWPPLAQAGEHESAKLLLSRNFRSRKEVLEATNFIFTNVLSAEMGELDYGEDEMLRSGANYVPSDRCGAEFHLLDVPAQAGGQRVRASEAEAAFAAVYIHDMLTSKFPVQDEKTREMRPVREEDIVILMRSPSTRLLDYRRAREARPTRVRTFLPRRRSRCCLLFCRSSTIRVRMCRCCRCCARRSSALRPTSSRQCAQSRRRATFTTHCCWTTRRRAGAFLRRCARCANGRRRCVCGSCWTRSSAAATCSPCSAQWTAARRGRKTCWPFCSCAKIMSARDTRGFSPSSAHCASSLQAARPPRRRWSTPPAACASCPSTSRRALSFRWSF